MHKHKTFLRLFSILSIFTLVAVLASCDSQPESFEIPTIAPEFLLPTALPTFTPLPSLTPIANATATRELKFRTIVVYDNGFKNGWDMEGEDLFVEPVEDIVYDGNRALKVEPRLAFSRLHIVATEQNQDAVLRGDIVNISFYLRSSEPIAFDDMTITAQGSNDNIFWGKNDRSAITTSGVSFEDTQLSFLGVGTIPEDTWARIEFAPQDQRFDPVYRFFTGVYLSNSSTFLAPYYIDRIEILMVDE